MDRGALFKQPPHGSHLRHTSRLHPFVRHALLITMSREHNSHSEDTEADSLDSECVNSDSVDSQLQAAAGPTSDQDGQTLDSAVPGWLSNIEHRDAYIGIIEQPPAQGYSCPYRKRNPNKFNERDYPDCAVEGFENMEDLM